MTSKPILLYGLTPAQIALIDRLAAAENGINLDKLEYREVVVWMELNKLGMANMTVQRRKSVIVLTDLGARVRDAGYLSKKPIVRLTEPQIAALRFLAGGPRTFSDMPGHMVDVCRRLGIRGWAEWKGEVDGPNWMRITAAGWQILKLVDSSGKVTI
ncbi:hypothetical protein [Mesorhizobium sp. SP-1A]|uniref:hypothetical protein n=1 Tax=Mesorhizobium sp. SP-1A TaxID=3077840 RepID=UPI0028F71475|nr:hypothetical protein [Mesorhizobium sp. SP-1A]